MKTKTSRQEHLQWCKDRALEYVDNNNLPTAFMSICSDLSEHEETKNHLAIGLGMNLMRIGKLDSAEEMRKFIEGFN